MAHKQQEEAEMRRLSISHVKGFVTKYFIKLFLRRLAEGDDTMNTCAVCQAAYSETLGQFHPWYIRKAALLAMHALPHRPDLLKRIFGTEECKEAALLVLPQTMTSCDEVYKRVHQLYREFDFHELP